MKSKTGAPIRVKRVKQAVFNSMFVKRTSMPDTSCLAVVTFLVVRSEDRYHGRAHWDKRIAGVPVTGGSAQQPQVVPHTFEVTRVWRQHLCGVAAPRSNAGRRAAKAQARFQGWFARTSADSRWRPGAKRARASSFDRRSQTTKVMCDVCRLMPQGGLQTQCAVDGILALASPQTSLLPQERALRSHVSPTTDKQL